MRQFNMKSILPQVIREGSWIQNALRREESIQIRFAEWNNKKLIVLWNVWVVVLFSNYNIRQYRTMSKTNESNSLYDYSGM